MMGLRLGAGVSGVSTPEPAGLDFTPDTLDSVRLASSGDWLVAEVLWGTMELSGSGGLTLKGLLGTLTPAQVTATVCLTAEMGV